MSERLTFGDKPLSELTDRELHQAAQTVLDASVRAARAFRCDLETVLGEIRRRAAA